MTRFAVGPQSVDSLELQNDGEVSRVNQVHFVQHAQQDEQNEPEELLLSQRLRVS